MERTPEEIQDPESLGNTTAEYEYDYGNDDYEFEELIEYIQIDPFMDCQKEACFQGELMTGQGIWMGIPNQIISTKEFQIKCYASHDETITLEVEFPIPNWNFTDTKATRLGNGLFLTTFTLPPTTGPNVLRCSSSSSQSINNVKIFPSLKWSEWSEWEECLEVRQKVSRKRNLSNDPSKIQHQSKYCRCYDLTELPRPRIVLLGMTGVGKSTLGNQLLGGNNQFSVGHTIKSHTTEISWRADHYLGTGQCITVIDTPGVADTAGQDYKQSLQLQQVLKDNIKSIDIFMLLFKGSNLRFDSSLVEMIQWYEAIFGKDMWKHVVTETTFWSHTEAEARKREYTMELTEEKRTRDWSNRFYRKPLLVDRVLDIPVLFIDPIARVFTDPCITPMATQREKEKFLEWTSRFADYFELIPSFDCEERCQAPNEFYSGIPWLSNPENGIAQVNDKSSLLIEWQVWTEPFRTQGDESFAYHISINEQKIQDLSGDVLEGAIKYKLTEGIISTMVKTIRMNLELNESFESELGQSSLNITMTNKIGVSKPVILKIVKEPSFTQWSEWSSCSVSCIDQDETEMGFKTRERKCLEGINSNKTCSDMDQSRNETDSCSGGDQEVVICPIDFKWAEWTDWSNCTCEDTFSIRSRLCINGSFGGLECPHPKEEEKEECQTAECPKDCQIGDWTAWSECSSTCWSDSDTDIPTRSRNRPILQDDEFGGVACAELNLYQEEQCNLRRCPKDGYWMNWSEWTSCTVTCGVGGTKTRSRSCVPPSDGGLPCPSHELNIQRVDCIVTEDCPCKLGEWQNWGPCSKECGKGTKTRTRSGTNTCDPLDFIESSECFNKACYEESFKLKEITTHVPGEPGSSEGFGKHSSK